MSFYDGLSREELAVEKEKVEMAYHAFQKQGLSLNMARGIPSAEQLDLSYGLLTCVTRGEWEKTEQGLDPRNYG